MDVRELIKELLEHDIDLEVEFEVGDDEISDFEIEVVGIHNRYLHFKLNVKGQELIESEDLEELKDRVEHLEGRVKDLEEENNSLQQRIDDI